MIIDDKTYSLSDSNYVKDATVKNRIIIGHTFSKNMNHFKGWEIRMNGKYKKTAMFTVTLKGDIYQHFSPNYYSTIFGDINLNESSISILLENEGWLIKDLNSENKFINYVGHIYNRKDSVVEKRWRNHTYWAPYSEEQENSLYELVKELCDNFEIPLRAIGHNTNFETVKSYHGILYKSNFEKYYTDISPAWDCLKFKDKIELKNE